MRDAWCIHEHDAIDEARLRLRQRLHVQDTACSGHSGVREQRDNAYTYTMIDAYTMMITQMPAGYSGVREQRDDPAAPWGAGQRLPGLPPLHLRPTGPAGAFVRGTGTPRRTHAHAHAHALSHSRTLALTLVPNAHAHAHAHAHVSKTDKRKRAANNKQKSK